MNDFADVPDHPHPFPEFAARYRTKTVPAIRHDYFESKPRESSRGVVPGNGLAAAFLKVGGRVYIRPRTYFQLMARQSK